MRPWIAVSIALLLASTAGSAAVARIDVAAAMHAVQPPVTLTAGTTGSTVLGDSATIATTTYTAVALVTATTHGFAGGANAWSLHLELRSQSGGGLLDSYTVRLCDPPDACVDQVLISAGTALQSSGAAVDLETSENDVTVQVSATKASLGPKQIDMHAVLVPSGGGAELRYVVGLTIQ